MPGRINITYATGVILLCLARGHRYGFDVMDTSGLPDGTVYPALRRLEGAGMLESQWEELAEATAAKRPPRRYYRLTAAGQQALTAALDRFPGLDRLVPADAAASEPAG